MHLIDNLTYYYVLMILFLEVLAVILSNSLICQLFDFEIKPQFQLIISLTKFLRPVE